MVIYGDKVIKVVLSLLQFGVVAKLESREIKGRMCIFTRKVVRTIFVMQSSTHKIMSIDPRQSLK